MRGAFRRAIAVVVACLVLTSVVANVSAVGETSDSDRQSERVLSVTQGDVPRTVSPTGDAATDRERWTPPVPVTAGDRASLPSGSLTASERTTIRAFVRSNETGVVFEPVTYDGSEYVIAYASGGGSGGLEYVGDAKTRKQAFADPDVYAFEGINSTFVFERTDGGLRYVPPERRAVIRNVTLTHASLFWANVASNRRPPSWTLGLHDQMLHSDEAEIYFVLEKFVNDVLKSEEDRYLAALQAMTTAGSDYALVPDSAAEELKAAETPAESANTALDLAQEYETQEYARVAAKKVDADLVRDALTRYADNIQRIDTDRVGYGITLVSLVLALAERQTYKDDRVEKLGRLQDYARESDNVTLPDGLDAAITELERQHENSDAKTVEAIEQWVKDSGVDLASMAVGTAGSKFGSWLVSKSAYAASVSSWASSSTAGAMLSGAASLAGTALAGWQIGGVLTGRGGTYAALVRAEYALETSRIAGNVSENVTARYGTGLDGGGGPPKAEAARAFQAATYVKRAAIAEFHRYDAIALERHIIGEYEDFIEFLGGEGYATEKKRDLFDRADLEAGFAEQVRSFAADEALGDYAEGLPEAGATPSFVATPARPTTGNAATFVAATGGTSYGWDFDGDGSVDRTTDSPTVTHEYTATGEYGVGLTVADATGERTATRTVSVRGGALSVDVTPSNVAAGSEEIIRVTVTDPGTGAPVANATVSLSGVANPTARTDADGFVAFAVEPSGDGNITITASKPGYGNGTATVAVGSDATPTANDTVVGTAPGESVTAAFDAAVSGGGTLSYAVDNTPDHGSVSTDCGRFTYTPESDFRGIDSFTYRASAGGETDTATVYASVRPDGAAVIDGVVRDARGNPIDGATVRVPLSGADLTTTTDARGAFTVDLRDREHPSNVNVFVEATGYETITRVVAPADPGLLAVELTPVSESVIQLSSTLHHLGDGDFSGAINSQFQEPVEGSTFTTELSLSSAQADPESAELVYTARGIQLDNPISVNGESVGTTAETAADGSLSERQLSLSPSTLQAGENTLRIEAAENWIGDLDDFELSSIRLRIETAGTVAEPPTARDVDVSTPRGREVSAAFNATDPNADIESYTIETAPEHGSVTAVGGSFEYRPDLGFVGTDSFTYRVTDAAGNTDTATVEVVVERGDAAPDFRVATLTAPATATVGDSVTVAATVTNAGLTAGAQTVELTFDGSVVAARDLALEPGQTGVIATSVTADSLGEVPLGVGTANDSRSTTVEFVTEALVCGSSTGDPHLHTFDGTEYDFQGAGEFVLAHSSGQRDFEIQARHVPVAGAVSSTSAVATAIDGTEVTIDATDATPLSVDGTARSLEDGGRLPVGDGIVRRDGDTYTVVYPGPDGEVNGTDERFSATLWGDRLDVGVCLDEDRDSTVEGLLGDLDGDPSDDIALADGTTLADPPAFDTLYGQFRSDWRVTARTSLFDYDADESADSFYEPDFPDRRVTVDDLDPAARDRAERRARNAGLEPGTAPFRNAVIDFALTNRTDYLASATTTTTVNANATGAVTATHRDLTGDGSRDIRLANGEVFFRIDGENVSGGLQVADAAGRVGQGRVLDRLDALPKNPYTASKSDKPTYEETVAFGVTADTGSRAAYRVVREYSYEHTGARVRIGWTLTLYDDSRYGVANLTITDVGSSPVEIDHDDGDIHDGIQVFHSLGLAGRSGFTRGVPVRARRRAVAVVRRPRTVVDVPGDPDRHGIRRRRRGHRRTRRRYDPDTAVDHRGRQR